MLPLMPTARTLPSKRRSRGSSLAKAKDEEETRARGAGQRENELPEDLRDPRSWLARLKECKARLEREAEEAALAQEAKISARQAEEEETGKKRRGRKPKDPDLTPRS